MNQGQYAELAVRLLKEAEEYDEMAKNAKTAEFRKEHERLASNKRREAREANELANDRGY